MAANSKIEWCEDTWNPLAGCSIVSPGCHNCYAMRMAARLEAMDQAKYVGTTKKVNGRALWTGKINLDEDALQIPLHTRKPTMWFVNSMSDLFHEDVPNEFIDKVFAMMALCPQHTFQVLTKRAERMHKYLSRHDVGLRWAKAIWQRKPLQRPQDGNEEGRPTVDEASYWTANGLPNVWLGISAEDQQRAAKRIIWLFKTPAAVRFMSAEPLLGALDLLGCLSGWDVCNSCGNIFTMPGVGHSECQCGGRWERNGFGQIGSLFPLDRLDWVIVGGESGPGARPCDLAWIRSIVKQCKAADVVCFVKQLGANVRDCDTTSAIHFDDPQCWPNGTQVDYHRVLLKNKKGGDPQEWPEDLRVREFPRTFKTSKQL